MILLTLAGRTDSFSAPFYTRADIDRLTTLKRLSFTGHQDASYNGRQDVSVEIPRQEGAVLVGAEEPDAETGVNGSVYVQYVVSGEAPEVVGEWIKLEGIWVRKE